MVIGNYQIADKVFVVVVIRFYHAQTQLITAVGENWRTDVSTDARVPNCQGAIDDRFAAFSKYNS